MRNEAFENAVKKLADVVWEALYSGEQYADWELGAEEALRQYHLAARTDPWTAPVEEREQVIMKYLTEAHSAMYRGEVAEAIDWTYHALERMRAHSYTLRNVERSRTSRDSPGPEQLHYHPSREAAPVLRGASTGRVPMDDERGGTHAASSSSCSRAPMELVRAQSLGLGQLGGATNDRAARAARERGTSSNVEVLGAWAGRKHVRRSSRPGCGLPLTGGSPPRH
jgi:hypothetical protein